MLKLDENGELELQKSIGGDDDDELTAAVELADGSIAALGTTRSFGSGNWDVWVIKVDSDLNVLWQKAIGSDESDWAPALAAGADGSILAAWNAPSEIGWGSDMRVARLDREGNLVLERIVGAASDSSAGSVAATQDGGFVLSGSTCLAGDEYTSMAVARFDADGEMVWQVGLDRGYFTVISVHESADGSIHVLGNQYLGDLVGYIGALLIRLVMEDGVPGSCNLLETVRMDLLDGSSAVTDSDAAAVDTAGVPFEPAPTEASPEVKVTRICPEG
jgi:hypothetical protein